MLIDLHCHTSSYSSCSSLSPATLFETAKQSGLDAVCLTEHDRLWPDDRLNAIAADHGLVVLRGMEVTTELGHVLVFGLDALPAGAFLAATLIAAVRDAGGFAALAHPARAGHSPVATADAAALFDSVEILNGSDGPDQNRSAASIAQFTQLPGIAGSDCHSVVEVGTVATVLPRPVANERELVEVLRMGQHSVRRLRPVPTVGH